jgi:mannose-6-phosphate isomerase
MWVGAHPAASSTVGGVPLTDRIAADPAGTLGPRVVDRFGPRLPFLMKLLAAEAPLSLQAHPDPAQAAAGFAAEEAAGIPRDAPHRRYVDPFHKPELLVAVSEFRALCGFRDPGASADLLARLGVPALDPVVADLREGDLAGAVARLLPGGATAPPSQAEVAAAAAAADRDGPYGLVGELAAAYPGDPAVVVALLLNQVRLAPGEAIFMPAGNLHMYLSGVAVEIMAASDNVLRGGLTSKHVDAAELLRVLRFEALDGAVRHAVPVAPGVVSWPVPVTDFALHRVDLDEACPRAELPVSAPCAVLCLAGTVRVEDGVAPVTLGAGEAGFGAVSPPGASTVVAEVAERRLALSGSGTAFLASVGWSSAGGTDDPDFSGYLLT